MLSPVLDTQDGSMAVKPSDVDLWSTLSRELSKRVSISGDEAASEGTSDYIEGLPLENVDCETLYQWVQTGRTAEVPPYDALFPWLHSYSSEPPACMVDRTVIIRSRPINDTDIIEDSGILRNSVDPSDVFLSWNDPINQNMLRFYITNKLIVNNLDMITMFIDEILCSVLTKVHAQLPDNIKHELVDICIQFKIMPFLKTDFESIKEFCDANLDKVGASAARGNSSHDQKKSSEALWKQYTNSFRRFDLQCTKMLEISDKVVVYCLNDEGHKNATDKCPHCIAFVRLLNLGLQMLRPVPETSANRIFVFNYPNIAAIPPELIGTPPLNTSIYRGSDDPLEDSIITPYDITMFNNWDRAFKIHEKLEIAKMSSRSCIDLEHKFWCGNTTDFRIMKFFKAKENTLMGKHFKIENDRPYPYYSPKDSVTTLPDTRISIDNSAESSDDSLSKERKLFNVPYVECEDKCSVQPTLYIRCSENAALLPTEKLWEMLGEILSDSTPSDDVMFSFPSSGSIGLGSLNMASISDILNTCYFMHLVSSKTDFLTLLHCRDGYTELSFLLVAYLLFIWDISLEEIIFKLNEDCKRPFYLFQTDLQVLGHLQVLIRDFSPKREGQETVMRSDGIPEPLAIDSEMFSNVFFIKMPETDIDLNKLNGPLPSRILDHLYLGSLEHAQSPALLRKLGITHIVSVGEVVSWLRPNSNSSSQDNRNRGMSATTGLHEVKVNLRGQRSATIMNGATSRMASPSAYEFVQDGFCILKINNLQDNGYDCISEQLDDILSFIDEAYKGGGKVLVHCMVGVSRSATVCIAECMKRFQCEVLKAYLYVRVRRLNIVIQPNLMFMYELLKWQEALGIERCMDWHIICRNILELNRRYV